MSGDWSILKTDFKYDVILGSELTYSEANYIKIINFVRDFMSQSGVCILANKIYYFGVGGNMLNFRKNLESSGLKC